MWTTRGLGLPPDILTFNSDADKPRVSFEIFLKIYSFFNVINSQNALFPLELNANHKYYEEISQKLYILSPTKFDHFNSFYRTVENR